MKFFLMFASLALIPSLPAPPQKQLCVGRGRVQPLGMTCVSDFQAPCTVHDGNGCTTTLVVLPYHDDQGYPLVGERCKCIAESGDCCGLVYVKDWGFSTVGDCNPDLCPSSGTCLLTYDATIQPGPTITANCYTPPPPLPPDWPWWPDEWVDYPMPPVCEDPK